MKQKLLKKKEYAKFRQSNKKYLHLLPARPELVYKDWKSWYEFLGGGYISTARRVFKSFKENQSFFINKNLSSRRQFYKYTKSNKLPYGISKSPSTTFIKEWKGWADFLGTSRKPRSKKS